MVRLLRSARHPTVIAVLTGCLAFVTFPISHAGPLDPVCVLPSSGSQFQSAPPQEQSLDPSVVQQAIDYATSHMRVSVQIFRNNCRVGAGSLEQAIDSIPLPVWSSAKSVVSLLVGIAAERGLLAVDDPIGKYRPAGPAWGDDAHRAITIGDLLTQTSGLRQSIISEAASLLSDPDIAQEALAQPLDHPPGTHFVYGQRPVDLLAFIVGQAVGQDLQTFAQENLFGPIGIPADTYVWLRDRAGNTYGSSNLMMTAPQYAKLGLMVQNGGVWNGHRVLSEQYLRQAAEPTLTNGCYGYLFWTNRGQSCTSAAFPSAITVAHNMIPSAPADLFAMVGFLHQNNFIIPSLHMTVTWIGALGDTAPDIGTLLSADPGTSDLYYNFFRILMRAVTDTHIPDPGPYQPPPTNLSFDPLNFADPSVLLADLFPNSTCNILACNSQTFR